LVVSRILGPPTQRLVEHTEISFVGVKTSFVVSGDWEMSVRVPVTVAAGEVES